MHISLDPSLSLDLSTSRPLDLSTSLSTSRPLDLSLSRPLSLDLSLNEPVSVTHKHVLIAKSPLGCVDAGAKQQMRQQYGCLLSNNTYTGKVKKCARACVRVCVCAREREREKHTHTLSISPSTSLSLDLSLYLSPNPRSLLVSVHMHVCNEPEHILMALALLRVSTDANALTSWGATTTSSWAWLACRQVTAAKQTRSHACCSNKGRCVRVGREKKTMQHPFHEPSE